MMTKLAVIGYVPPPTAYAAAESFLKNIRAWQTANDLILFSDHPYPDVIQLKGSPECVKDLQYPDGRKNTFAVNNLIWLTALRILDGKGYTHFLYIEADCRVTSDYWDKRVFDEFFNRKIAPLIGGTVVGYNIHNRNIDFSREWNRFIEENQGSRFPITSFGGVGAAHSHEPAVLVNGALGVYDYEYVKRLFPLDGRAEAQAALTAFDYHLGRELVREFGERVLQNIAHMDRVYSSYGNVQTTEEARLTLLKDGAVVAVHQVKSDATGPLPILEAGGGERPACNDASVREGESGTVGVTPLICDPVLAPQGEHNSVSVPRVVSELSGLLPLNGSSDSGPTSDAGKESGPASIPLACGGEEPSERNDVRDGGQLVKVPDPQAKQPSKRAKRKAVAP